MFLIYRTIITWDKHYCFIFSSYFNTRSWNRRDDSASTLEYLWWFGSLVTLSRGKEQVHHASYKVNDLVVFCLFKMVKEGRGKKETNSKLLVHSNLWLMQKKFLDLNHWSQLIFENIKKLNKPDSWCWMEVALCLRNSSLKLSKFLLTKIFCISWVRTLLTISGRLLWSDTGKRKCKRDMEKKNKQL